MAKAPKAAEAASNAGAADTAAPGTRDVIIRQPVTHDGEALEIGRSYAIEAKAAQALIDCGAAEDDD